jgi:ribonuclease HI
MTALETQRGGKHARAEVRQCSPLDLARDHLPPVAGDTDLGLSPATREGANVVPKPMQASELSARRDVVLANRRARKAAKPAYVNTDASWRDGRAGLAYEGALGIRTELVECRDNHEAEYLALLMAMGDAERCLAGRIAFRTDSQTVAGLQRGSNGQYEPLRGRVKLLLSRHPEWTLLLVEGVRNKVADDLARRPFKTAPEGAQARPGRAHGRCKNGSRGRA